MDKATMIVSRQVADWLASFQQDESTESKPNQQPLLLYFSLNGALNSHPFLRSFMCRPKKNGAPAKTGRVEISARSFTSDTETNPFHQLSEADCNLLLSLFKIAKSSSYDSGTSLRFSGSGQLLKQFIEMGKCFASEHFDQLFCWGESRKGSFQWKLVGGHEGQKLDVELNGSGRILLTDPLCYIDDKHHTIGFVDFEGDASLASKLLNAPVIPLEYVQEVHKQLAAKAPVLRKSTPHEFITTILKVDPQPCITFEKVEAIHGRSWRGETEEVLCATVAFKYGDHILPHSTHTTTQDDISYHMLEVRGKEIIKIERQHRLERQMLDQLRSLQWHSVSLSLKKERKSCFTCQLLSSSSNDVFQQALSVLEVYIPLLKERGWQVTFDPSFPIHAVHDGDEWYLDVEEGPAHNDWFDAHLGVLIDGERVNLLPMLTEMAEELNKNKGWGDFDNLADDFKLSLLTADNKLIRVPIKRVRNILHHLMVEFASGSKHENLKLSKWNSAFLAEFASGEAAAKTRWMGSSEIKRFAESLKDCTSSEPVAIPEGLKCELRPYQHSGLNWLQQLRRWNMNGILADDMGLGKTVQTLAHILIEKGQGRMQAPVLVVAPTSLMPNWFNEAARLAPELKVLVLHGHERKLNFSKIKEHDLILTTYPLLMRDKESLLSNTFHILILDEAQTVKNFKTQAYQVLQQIKANHRLCLSGTPMENHLGELWSLFHLLMPGFLGDQKTFQEIYRKPIEKLAHQPRRESLIKRIKPFILRRTKQQVALDLPAKTEIIHKIEFNEAQRDLYEAIRLRAQEKVMRQIQENGLERSQIIVLDALLKLRQVCCDPRLVKTEGPAITKIESAKLECLMDMLVPMVEAKRKILIFSQFSSMLDLIAQELISRGIAFTILTGDTKDRATPVQQFQEGPFPIMLISLKAGGVGLNLTAADTVFHYDPWWNPAAENQATDRAHRIGQKNALFVYKLLIAGSLEEKILAMQERKKNLVASLIDANANTGAKLTMEDLQCIFEPLPKPV